MSYDIKVSKNQYVTINTPGETFKLTCDESYNVCIDFYESLINVDRFHEITLRHKYFEGLGYHGVMDVIKNKSGVLLKYNMDKDEVELVSFTYHNNEK